ncbi:hypothetical protein TeGR_g5378 [Tetraparma gracilis]|uniref:RING-type domain-containing protein n=1 Tax=Tetraparma gracilis TaxID=2962635 RepID=A0ABQ6MHS6_9STRA|nr:hypothetical protein TeGR_g5378 [Tetraparma gracilis]
MELPLGPDPCGATLLACCWANWLTLRQSLQRETWEIVHWMITFPLDLLVLTLVGLSWESVGTEHNLKHSIGIPPTRGLPIGRRKLVLLLRKASLFAFVHGLAFFFKRPVLFSLLTTTAVPRLRWFFTEVLLCWDPTSPRSREETRRRENELRRARARHLRENRAFEAEFEAEVEAEWAAEMAEEAAARAAEEERRARWLAQARAAARAAEEEREVAQVRRRNASAAQSATPPRAAPALLPRASKVRAQAALGAFECSICLETLRDIGTLFSAHCDPSLHAEQRICSPCAAAHVSDWVATRGVQQPRCPVCPLTEMSLDDVERVGGALVRSQLAERIESTVGEAAVRARSDAGFGDGVALSSTRLCPAPECRTPFQWVDGCEHFRCPSCGSHFTWRQAIDPFTSAPPPTFYEDIGGDY